VKMLKRLSAVAAIVAAFCGFGGVAMASTGSAESVEACPGGTYGTWCALTVAAVNVRAQPTSQSQFIVTLPYQSWFSLDCWTTGESIHGDNVWYRGIYTDYQNGVPVAIDGWVTGYYLATGHDPASPIGHC
jgi:hypothetical protein